MPYRLRQARSSPAPKRFLSRGFDGSEIAGVRPANALRVVTRKPRHFETRSKRVSLKLGILRANVGANIAWLRASIINGWLGTPARNPELERVAARQRRQARQMHLQYIQRRTIERRLRLGRVGGGRVPHRNRGRPTRPATT